MRRQFLPVAIGVFAHNEETNIGPVLTSILKSKLKAVQIKQIMVVSSGSYDRTNRRVKLFMKRDKRIKLIDEAERYGKSAAINTFLMAVSSPVVVTMSADLVLQSQALEEICLPFTNPAVGMVGAHPVPRDTDKSSLRKEIELLWELHHQVSLGQPKCGEMVAFRNIIRKIPLSSAVDEATIEVLLRLLGYSVIYAPRSIVFNRGPRTVREYLIQRRRVQAGHLWVSTTYNYKVSTMNVGNILGAVLAILKANPFKVWPMARLVGLEVVAWVLGWIDYYLLGKNPFKWEMIKR